MVTAYLSAALQALTGVAPSLTGPYLVCAEPGGEPYLARWDEATLGPKPTDAAIEMAGLAAAKETACASIDAKAEALRAGVLTPGSGQAAEYYLTHAEAASYLAAVTSGQTPTDANYPFLLAEQAALAATSGAEGLSVVATAIMANVGGSKTALAAIKTARRTGKITVNAALDVAGVAAAEAAVAWPTV